MEEVEAKMKKELSRVSGCDWLIGGGWWWLVVVGGGWWWLVVVGGG